MLYDLNASELKVLRGTSRTYEFRDAEMLWAVFLTEPEIVARVLPKPLKPLGEPIAVAFVARYPHTSFGETYNEGALFLRARYKGEEGAYCLAMPVDNDMAMVGAREQLGFPKKIAEEITLDREEDHVVGRVVRRGTEILRIECELTEEAGNHDMDRFGEAGSDPDGTPCWQGVSWLFKYAFSPSGKGFDYIPRLVRQVTLLRPQEGLMSGTGDVTLTSSVVDPLGEIPVDEIVSMNYGIWDNDMLPGKVVARAWNIPGFAPHAMFKNDYVAIVLNKAGVKETG